MVIIEVEVEAEEEEEKAEAEEETAMNNNIIKKEKIITTINQIMIIMKQITLI